MACSDNSESTESRGRSGLGATVAVPSIAAMDWRSNPRRTPVTDIRRMRALAATPMQRWIQKKRLRTRLEIVCILLICISL
jgi:hypothetical protein